MTEKTRIIRTTAFLIVVTFTAKAMQVLIFPLVAAYFGTSAELDSFIVAFSIPTLIFSTLLGSFGMVFIPFFTEQRHKQGEISAWEFASSLINAGFFLSIIITVICIVFSPWIISQIAPGMSLQYKKLAIMIARYLSVTILLFSGTAFFTAILNVHRSFLLPAVIGLIANLFIVFTLLAARQRLDVYVLGFAYLLSAASSAGLLLFLSRNLWRNRYRFVLRFHAPETKAALRMFMIASLIGIMGQAILIANRYFASFLPAGSIATLEYATRAVIFTVELLALSVAAPLYQMMSRDAASDDRVSLGATFSLGIKMIAVILFPITLFTVFFRAPIFSLLLEHGKFTAQNSMEVSSAFLFLSLAMVSNGFAQLIVSIFYAMKKAGLLLVLSAGGVIVNIILDAALYRPLGVKGLALATSITAVLGAVVAMKASRRQMEGFDGIYLIKFAAKVLSLAFLSCGLSWVAFKSISYVVNSDTLGLLWRLSVSAIVCMVSYVMLMSYCKVEEITFILSKFKERLKTANV